MEETFHNLKGMGIIVDDILVSGKDEEHNENLKEVLQKAREVGVKFNSENCIFGSTTVGGYIIKASISSPFKAPTNDVAVAAIQHVREKDLPIAKTLSRLHPPHINEECSLDIEFHVHSVVKSNPVSNKKMGIICEEKLKRPGYDKTYIKCERSVVQHQWHHPKRKQSHLPRSIAEEDTTAVACITPRDGKTKQRARSAVYWPKLNSTIEELIQNHKTCEKFSRNNQKEPLILTPIPKYSWECLGLDFCKVKGRDYLIMCDYYSCF
ncbi:hypothetical protein QYM36_001796 [Artemia franciscana]|uniref:Reverse transcriptase domain-containing protein n=1 Tax=Artemia franciscana TaxID=6661 RepID=A0AA88I891_ARTSF|nr:hypothetical protein QYM36_001796 [Artemia franciscana]